MPRWFCGWWLARTLACMGQKTVAFSLTLADVLFAKGIEEVGAQ